MPTLQVASATPFSGIGKVSLKPYNMLRIKAIVTDDNGVVELGEIAFFQRGNEPFPVAIVGNKYEPIISFESEKGNLTPRITGLKPVAASSVPK